MSTTKAVVLGGGGITGIAWETGILIGLLEQGIDLKTADTILGTSAGSFVGAALASGHDLTDYLTQITQHHASEDYAEVSKAVYQGWARAFQLGGSDPKAVGRYFGEIITTNPSSVPQAVRKESVLARLTTTTWPKKLKVTAVDAATGDLQVFDQTSGIALVDGVSASGAVPGVWPHVTLKGRDWIDGGMVSPTNALQVKGADLIIMIAPLHTKYGAIPDPAAEAATLAKSATVELIIPDLASQTAIGTNIYDASKATAAGLAGIEQGCQLASKLKTIWVD